MYQSETMDAVRDAAQTLTREGKVLTVGNPEFPLAVFADTYKVDEVPTNDTFGEEEAVSIEEHFDEINQDSTPAEDDARESIVTNLYTAVAKIQFNTTNVIIPAIKAMHSVYAGMQSASSEPEYAVRAWRYLAPHNSPALVNHINTRYTTARPKETYETFHLESKSADAIIEMISVNNPHMDQEELTEWALQVGTDRLEAVWNSLFGQSGGLVVPGALPYMSLQAAPFNVDELLVAYFLCGHYTENPVIVPNVSVDLDEWEHKLKLLHEMFGFYLSRAYMRRADAREQGVMILTNEAINPIDTRRAVVVVNGDVFDPWVVAGGDIQAILGAAVENTGVTDVRHLDANAAKFIARWHAVYPAIKQAAIDFADRQRVNNIVATFREVSRTDPLRELWSPEIEARIGEGLRYIRRDDYDNPYRVFSTLICRIYFPGDVYIDYLDSIDAYGQDFPDASIRELNTQALITLLAIFQAKQIIVEPFTPVIEESEEGIDESIDGGLLAMAGESEEEETEEIDMTADINPDESVGDSSADLGDDEFGGVDTAGSTDLDESTDTDLDTSVGEDGTEGEDLDDFTNDETEDDPYGELEESETEELIDENVDEEIVDETEEAVTEDEEFESGVDEEEEAAAEAESQASEDGADSEEIEVTEETESEVTEEETEEAAAEEAEVVEEEEETEEDDDTPLT